MTLRQPFSHFTRTETGRLKLPEQLDSAGILVGWSMEHDHARQPIGFTFGDPDKNPEHGFVDPILMDSEGHLITIAPTGAGKGIGCIIPALLRHEGPAIVIDPKGENAMVTARHRRSMGQEIIVLDPMGVTNLEAGSFNPLDLVNVADANGVDVATALVSALLPGSFEGNRNRYWVNRGQQLLLAVLLHVATDRKEPLKNLLEAREVVNRMAGDPASMGATFKKSRHPEVRMIEGNLQIAAAETLGGIVSFAQEGVDFLRGPQVAKAVRSTSFEIDAITRGDPVTIYIVLPPHMLESHGRLLRLWIASLMMLITRRRARPDRPTLFVLDEAAQLGTLGELRQAITLLRGYGLQTWSFWQDVSQLKLLYPADWQTMLNNCSVIQTFGPNNLNAARDMAELTGFVSPEALLELERSEMLLQIAGDEVVVAKRPNYLTDPIFAGLFDQNPLFDEDADPVPKPRIIREYLRPEKRVLSPEREEAGEAGREARARRAPGPANPVDALLAERLNEWIADQVKKPARQQARRAAKRPAGAGGQAGSDGSDGSGGKGRKGTPKGNGSRSGRKSG